MDVLSIVIQWIGFFLMLIVIVGLAFSSIVIFLSVRKQKVQINTGSKFLWFDYYQKEAFKTMNIHSKKEQMYYSALGLASEAGEVAGKIKRIIRDDSGKVLEDRVLQIKDELGDVLWYVAALSTVLGLSLNDIADQNLQKVRDRQNRGVISGEGDKR